MKESVKFGKISQLKPMLSGMKNVGLAWLKTFFNDDLIATGLVLYVRRMKKESVLRERNMQSKLNHCLKDDSLHMFLKWIPQVCDAK